MSCAVLELITSSKGRSVLEIQLALEGLKHCVYFFYVTIASEAVCLLRDIQFRSFQA